MKNKKFILITATVLLLSLTLFAFTACNKDKGFDMGLLVKGQESVYPSQVQITDLNAYSSYENMFVRDDFLFFYDTDEQGQYKYCLYNYITQQELAAGEVNASEKIVTFAYESGIFMIYTEDLSNNSFTSVFYDAFGEVISFIENVTYTDAMYSENFGYLILSNKDSIIKGKDGKGTYIPYSPSHQVNEMTLVDDVLLYNESGVTYVYDLSLNYKTSYSESANVPIPEGYSKTTVNFGDKKIIRFEKTVTDEDAPYDFIDTNGNKILISQYVFDIKTGKASKLSNSNIIQDALDLENTAGYYVAKYYPTKGKGISLQGYYGVFDSSFNLVANLSSLVNYEEIQSISKFGTSTIVFTPKHFFFFRGSSLAYTLDVNNAKNILCSRYFSANSVLFDAVTLKTVTASGIPANATLQATDDFTDGLLYYTNVKEIENAGGTTDYVYEAYSYNLATSQATLIDDTGSISFENGFYTVYDSEAKTYSAYCTFNGQAIFENVAATSVSYAASLNSKIIFAPNSDGTVTRYILQMN